MATAGKAAPKRNKSRSVNATEVAALGRLLPFERFFLRTFAEKKKKKKSVCGFTEFRFPTGFTSGEGGRCILLYYIHILFRAKKKQKKLVPFRVGRRISAGVRRGATGGERPTETEAKRVSRDAGHGFTEFYRVLLAPERLCRLVPSFTGF